MTSLADAQTTDVAAERLDLTRTLTFIAGFLLAWITLEPFADLTSAQALDVVEGRYVYTYVAFAALACVCFAQVAYSDRQGLLSLATPSFSALAIWIVVSCVVSQAPATSTKRACLCGFVSVVAASMFLLPRGRDHLASMLALAAAILLGLCYAGVVLFPEYAIHQATDAVEPALAGSWRGLFAHKNDASAVLSMAAFIGVFVARCNRKAVGAIICALSLLFVIFSDGKSSTALCAVAFLVSLIVTRRPGMLGVVAALLPLLALNAFGVGSTLTPSLAIPSALPLDASFTGRADIWRFALSQIPGHLGLGYGFATFWSSETVRNAGVDAATWAGGAAHAHNGYLDSMLAMGAPGLAFAVWAFVIQPLRDLQRALRAGEDPALVMMLSQIWLFGLYLSSLESFLFDRANPIWFTFLFAVFGLRYISCYRVISA